MVEEGNKSNSMNPYADNQKGYNNSFFANFLSI